MQAPRRHDDQTSAQARNSCRKDRTAKLGVAGQAQAPGELTEVSAHGCCVTSRASWLSPGRVVAIALPSGPALESIVRWRRGSFAGLELLGPIAAANRSDWLALID